MQVWGSLKDIASGTGNDHVTDVRDCWGMLAVTDDLMAKTYTEGEICLAAGISRAVLHSWVARRLVSQEPGPGAGTARLFTTLDGIRVAAIATLGRLGAPVGMAAGYAAHIMGAYVDEPTVMVLGERKTGRPSMHIGPAKDLPELLGKMPNGVTILDLSKIAADVQRTLSDPATRYRADPRIRTTSSWEGATDEKVRVLMPDPSGQEPAPVTPKRRRRRELANA
jgi:hypothetical protein